MRRIFILILLILAQQVSFGQTKKDESKLAKEAQSYFNAAQFLEAFPMYSQLVSLSPTNSDYSYHFGVCALYCDEDKSNAIKYLKQAEKAGYTNVELFYYLGKAYHFSYQFSEAAKYYELYLDNANQKELEKYDALRTIQMCIYGTKLLKNPKELIVKKKVDADRQGFYRLMNLEAVGGKIINTPPYLLNSKDKKSAQPHLIHINSNPRTIYYASYSDSSSLDIWQAELQANGEYGSAKKVPGLVNTIYNEDYPFIHPNGKVLYFSSTGHNTMGGYDIFKSELDTLTKRWKKPVNLGFAYNSPADDIFFICDAANQSAIFASGRTSNHTQYSLYHTSFDGKNIDIIYAKGNFYSDLNPENASALIVVKDLETGEIIDEISTDNKTGKFDIYFPKPGKYSYTITVPDQNEKFTKEFDVQPDKSGSVYFPQQVHLAKDASNNNSLLIKNGSDAKLDNSMEDAFAGLIRSKAKMTITKSESDPSALEKSMTNAPALAGFSKGKSPQDILQDMKNEINELSKQSSIIEEQKKKSYQLANQNLVESNSNYAIADSLVNIINEKIEAAKAQKNPYILSDSDKELLEKSISYRNLADQKRIAALAALQLGKQLENYQNSIPLTIKELKERSSKLQAYIKENNVDGTIDVLKEERTRLLQEQSRPKKPNNALPSAAKSTAEEHETNLKKYEKLIQDLNVLEAKRIEDEQNNSQSLGHSRSAFKDKRSEIMQFDKTVKGTYDKAASAKYASEIYTKISENEDLGLKVNYQKELSKSEITNLTTLIEELNKRSSEPNKFTPVYEQGPISPFRNYNLDENNPSSVVEISSSNKGKSNDVTSNKGEVNNTERKNEIISNDSQSKNPKVNSYSPKEGDSQDVALALKASRVMKEIKDSAQFKEFDSHFAYEERAFFEILKKYPVFSGNFKERSRYDSIQNALSEIESAYKSEADPKKKSVLQAKMGTLERQRSALEIKNKDVFRDVANAELSAEVEKATKNISLNKTKLERELLLNAIIKSLKNDADSILNLAKKEREKAVKANNENEKAQLLRSAFSKEMMATDMYKHINKAIDALPIFELYTSKDETFLINSSPEEIRKKYSTHKVEVKEPIDNNATATNNELKDNNDSKEIGSNKNDNNKQPEVVSNDLKKEIQSIENENGISKSTKKTKTSENENGSGISTDRPSRVDKTYFLKVNESAYNNDNPIPIDEPIPSGAIYSIQIGAFRNPIPNETFSGFSPVYGQTLPNGLTRYLAGYFVDKQEAIKARNEIQALGYTDAFITSVSGLSASQNNKIKYTNQDIRESNDDSAKLNKDINPVSAEKIENSPECFYTIQVGVYGRPANQTEITLDNLFVYYSKSTGMYKYSTGKYSNKKDAIADLNGIKSRGFNDAFVTAYFNGERVSIQKADQLILNDNRPKSENFKSSETKIEGDAESNIYEFKLSELYGIYNCCDENSGECNNPDNKEVIRRFTLISNGSGVAINGKNETTNFQWKYVKDNNNPIQGMEEILGPDYSFYYKNGNIHLGKYCKPKK